MSVLITLRITGDANRIEQALTSDPDRLKQVSDRARSKGALRHTFYASTDGKGVLVVDEWESAEAFSAVLRREPGDRTDDGRGRRHKPARGNLLERARHARQVLTHARPRAARVVRRGSPVAAATGAARRSGDSLDVSHPTAR